MKVTYEYECARCAAVWEEAYTVLAHVPAPLPQQPKILGLHLCQACEPVITEAVRRLFSTTTASGESSKLRVIKRLPPIGSGWAG